MRRLASFPIVLMALAACSPGPAVEEAPPPEPLTAFHLSELIAADGAAHTVAVLSGPADPTGIQKVFDGVATGQADWLAVVPALAPVLDGEQADSLQNALAAALPRNPGGVLELMPETADVDLVCGVQDAEARAAVAAVEAPELRAARAECLRGLDGAEASAAR